MSENIDRIRINDKEIILIGTAHISKESVELVEKTILEEKPDVVAVEICKTRYKAIVEKDKWQNTDIVKIIKEKKVAVLLVNLILSSFQKKVGEKIGIKPGQEMITAIEKAKEINATVELIDREVSITLTRLWRSIGFWGKLKILFQILFSFGETKNIKSEDIEKMKKEDMIKVALEEFEKTSPILGEVLIKERDKYLASKIQNINCKKLVAVVGAGHISGIKENLNKEINIKELEEIPKASKSSVILKWSFSLLIIFALVYGFFIGDISVSKGILKWWILSHSILAGLGALICLAHPLTILVAVLVSPITALNPMIAAGWFAGLTEAFIRKPIVKDFENLSQDTLSFNGFWKNKVTRILLITVLTNIGSSLGTFIALPIIVKYLI